MHDSGALQLLWMLNASVSTLGVRSPLAGVTVAPAQVGATLVVPPVGAVGVPPACACTEKP